MKGVDNINIDNKRLHSFQVQDQDHIYVLNFAQDQDHTYTSTKYKATKKKSLTIYKQIKTFTFLISDRNII